MASRGDLITIRVAGDYQARTIRGKHSSNNYSVSSGTKGKVSEVTPTGVWINLIGEETTIWVPNKYLKESMSKRIKTLQEMVR